MVFVDFWSAFFWHDQSLEPSNEYTLFSSSVAHGRTGGVVAGVCFFLLLQSALIYFPIEISPVSLTQKGLEAVQRPPAEAPGKRVQPSPINLGQISTFNVESWEKQ